MFKVHSFAAMIHIGEYNSLRIDRIADPGAFLVDTEENDVLLPHKYLLDNMVVDDYVNVFVYKDNQGRPIATTLKPYATVGEFAVLEVNECTEHGCFLELGIQKDVLLPFREQRSTLNSGDKVLVYIYLDLKTERLVATEKTRKHLEPYTEELNREPQKTIIAEETPLGYKCIVLPHYNGMLYHNELHAEVNVGDILTTYIKRVRGDGKLDLQLEPVGFKHIKDFSSTLFDTIKEEGGFLALHDKSKPDEIKAKLGVSKKVFKQAVGQLYKTRQITIEKNGLRLIDSSRKKG